MGCDGAVDPAATAWPWPGPARRSANTHWPPRRAGERRYMGRCAPRVWRAGALGATLRRLGPGRHWGAAVARAPEPARGPRRTRMDARLPRRQVRACPKGGAGGGKARIGRGRTVMAVADGHGLPLGVHVDRAPAHASQLADAPLAAVRVPQQRGRPRTRPKAPVADTAYGSRAFRQRLRRRGIKPTLPSVERRPRRRPERGARSTREQVIARAGKAGAAWAGGLRHYV
jgi:hypothetical protein